ncbi:MAG: hypothetical protein RJA37_1606, partial [Verrucomicrobiota bacterium]
MRLLLLSLLAFSAALPVSAEDKPAEPQQAPAAKKKAGKKVGAKSAPFVPEKVEGVSEEQLAKIREQLPKAYMSAGAAAARKRLAELKEQSEFASPLEKKDMKTDFENATYDMRKALKEAMIAADPAIEKGAIENINRERAEAAKAAKPKETPKGKNPKKPEQKK